MLDASSNTYAVGGNSGSAKSGATAAKTTSADGAIFTLTYTPASNADEVFTCKVTEASIDYAETITLDVYGEFLCPLLFLDNYLAFVSDSLFCYNSSSKSGFVLCERQQLRVAGSLPVYECLYRY